MTRAASAAACVPTWAPVEAAVAELIVGTQRGSRAPASCVFLIHGEGVAAGVHEIERTECVDLHQRDFVSDTAQVRRDPIGQRGSETVAHLSAVAIYGNPTVGPDFDGSQARVTAGAVVLGSARDAGTDENSRLLSARFLRGALRPDRVLLQLIEDFGRADRYDVGVPPHRLPAASGIAAAEFDRVERQGRADLVDLHFKRGHGLYGAVTTHRAGRHAARVVHIVVRSTFGA